MATPPRSFSRAAFAGLALGLFGAALVFLWSSWVSSQKECEFEGTEECLFEIATNLEIARLQGFAAIGCALVSGGLYLAARRS